MTCTQSDQGPQQDNYGLKLINILIKSSNVDFLNVDIISIFNVLPLSACIFFLNAELSLLIQHLL